MNGKFLFSLSFVLLIEIFYFIINSQVENKYAHIHTNKHKIKKIQWNFCFMFKDDEEMEIIYTFKSFVYLLSFKFFIFQMILHEKIRFHWLWFMTKFLRMSMRKFSYNFSDFSIKQSPLNYSWWISRTFWW